MQYFFINEALEIKICTVFIFYTLLLGSFSGLNIWHTIIIDDRWRRPEYWTAESSVVKKVVDWIKELWKKVTNRVKEIAEEFFGEEGGLYIIGIGYIKDILAATRGVLTSYDKVFDWLYVHYILKNLSEIIFIWYFSFPSVSLFVVYFHDHIAGIVRNYIRISARTFDRWLRQKLFVVNYFPFILKLTRFFRYIARTLHHLSERVDPWDFFVYWKGVLQVRDFMIKYELLCLLALTILYYIDVIKEGRYRKKVFVNSKSSGKNSSSNKIKNSFPSSAETEKKDFFEDFENTPYKNFSNIKLEKFKQTKK